MIKLLNLFDYFNTTESIEIAKGKYKIPETLKEGLKKVKRAIK